MELTSLLSAVALPDGLTSPALRSLGKVNISGLAAAIQTHGENMDEGRPRACAACVRCGNRESQGETVKVKVSLYLDSGGMVMVSKALA